MAKTSRAKAPATEVVPAHGAHDATRVCEDCGAAMRQKELYATVPGGFTDEVTGRVVAEVAFYRYVCGCGATRALRVPIYEPDHSAKERA